MRKMTFTALLGAVLSLPAAAEDAPRAATLGQLGVAPDQFDGALVSTQAAMAMVVTQKALSQCPKKTTAVMVTPPITGGQMGAMATVQYQVCVDEGTAMNLAALPAGATLNVTGRVQLKRTMGVLVAIVFEEAKVAPDGVPSPALAPL